MILTKNVIMLAGEARSGKDTSADILEKKLKERGYHVTRTYFAKALKQSLKKVFNLTDEHVFGSLKETPMRLRLDYNSTFQLILEELHHGSLMSIDIHLRDEGILAITESITAHMLGTIIQKAERQGDEYIASPRQLMQWWGTEAVRLGAYEDAWVDCVHTDIDMEAMSHQVAIITDTRFDNEVNKTAKRFNDADEERVVVVRINRNDKKQVAKHASEQGISDSLVDYEIENNDTLDALADKLESVLKEIL